MVLVSDIKLIRTKRRLQPLKTPQLTWINSTKRDLGKNSEIKFCVKTLHVLDMRYIKLIRPVLLLALILEFAI